MGRQVRALFPEYNPAGREVALRRFPLDRMLRETERVYEEVLGNQGR